jgi:short-subunit dehydrogenase involved in D-alanine esterification of teichoic acids
MGLSIILKRLPHSAYSFLSSTVGSMSTPALAILITGSNQGLGFEPALHLSKHLHIHLFVSGRNPSRVQEALENITKEDDCKAIVDSVCN